MTPATQALAYRIWHYCTPRGWNCTHTEVADALGEAQTLVTGAVRAKDWGNRFRTSKRDVPPRTDPRSNAVGLVASGVARIFRGNHLDE